MFAELISLLGMLVVSLVGFQLLLGSYRGLVQTWNDRTAQRLRIEKLNREINDLRAQHRQAATSLEGWSGTRKFLVDRTQVECDGVMSYYLSPHDNKALPAFLPGQYLTFHLKIPGEKKKLVRCYSLSDAPGKGFYRCSIKRVAAPDGEPAAPPGRVSNYFHDNVQQGDLLDVQSPRGSFHLDLESTRPIVLVAAGIGVTPMVSMLQTLAAQPSSRPAILFYGVRHSGEHIFKQELRGLCENHANFRQVVCYSRPLASDKSPSDYDIAGRVTVDRIREVVDGRASDFFVCGPGGFMQSIVHDLQTWGVPEEQVHTEAFGPSAIQRPRSAAPTVAPDPTAPPPEVTFSKSQTTVGWTEECASLLELAESQAIDMEAGCRAGNCGTCAVAIREGSVDYFETPSAEIAAGECLPCICVPQGRLILDA